MKLWSINIHKKIRSILSCLDQGSLINSLSPNSDLNQVSHCNIKGLSVRDIMRTENMITQAKNSVDILTASPRFFL